SAALMASVARGAHGPLDGGDDGEAPWHDPAMALPERMKLAGGRPLRRRMMAAMGQQDCGQCGFNCEDYSNAIALHRGERRNLCVPGGKETARTLKQLYEELAPAAGAAPALAREPAATAPTARPAPGRSRDHPVTATLLSRTRLNKPGSGKETWHIE